MMKLFSEQQILDPQFRKLILQEISAEENVARKKEHYRRDEIYKDKIKKYIVEALKDEGLRGDTVARMSNRASNINLCKKVINKLARTYLAGTQRTATVNEQPNVDATKQVHKLFRLLKFDEKMKKGDRYRELHKNCRFHIVPKVVTDPTEPEKKYKLVMRTLAPWQYDVIPDANDEEIARVLVLSDFIENDYALQSASIYDAGVHGKNSNGYSSNGRDDAIADSPADSGRGQIRTFVWWSDNYHFTTNDKGEVIPEMSPEDGRNPIGRIPGANNADEQDGHFWAEGGADIIEGTVLVNKIITDMFYVQFNQGFGQFVATGKNLKDSITIGPDKAIVIEYDPAVNDPKPEVSVVSANPDLDSWMRTVEQYVALLLTTNNLSPANVSASLTASNFPSAIAMLVENSEATNDIDDKKAEYSNIERELTEIVQAWQNIFYDANALVEDFEEVGKLPEGLSLVTRFNDLKPAMTEAEKLGNIKLRKELGINEMVDLILKDNPDMTEEEAQQKLMRIQAEKMSRMAAFSVGAPNDEQTEVDPEGETETDDDENGGTDESSDEEE